MLRGPHGSAIKRAYSANTALARDARADYFAGIAEYLQKRHPVRFRWHVSGDIIDADYLARMVDIAERFPSVKFLAFTKAFDVLEEYVSTVAWAPENLTIRLSQWYGRVANQNLRSHFWSAWYREEHTIAGRERYESEAAQALQCPGNCAECALCWAQGADVVFDRH